MFDQAGVVVSGAGQRIKTAGAPWMTPQQPAQTEAAAAQRAMSLYCFNCVTRARRCEPAVLSEIWAQHQPVKLEDPNQDYLHRFLTHCQSFCSAAVRSACVMLLITGRHITTRSTAGRSCWAARKLSLTRRLMRFLATARLAHFFEIASPSRACAHGPRRARIVNARSLQRTAWSKTRRNSQASVRRTRGPKRCPCSTCAAIG